MINENSDTSWVYTQIQFYSKASDALLTNKIVKLMKPLEKEDKLQSPNFRLYVPIE